MQTRFIAALIAALGACSCGDDGTDADAGGGPRFPIDSYQDSYVEVRNCRRSGGEHDINFYRVLADPAALEPYNNRTDPFPDGAVVLKEEYDFADNDCSGPIVQWSVMDRRSGGPAELLGWGWQRVLSTGDVVEEDVGRCYGCHQGCGFPPDGYEGTCTVP